MKILLASALLLLASCATHRTYESSLMEWEGKSVGELTKAWGVPSTISSLRDGGKLYLYFRRNEDKLNVRTPTSDKIVPLYDCKTSFLSNPQGIIEAWKFEGHACHHENLKR